MAISDDIKNKAQKIANDAGSIYDQQTNIVASATGTTTDGLYDFTLPGVDVTASTDTSDAEASEEAAQADAAPGESPDTNVFYLAVKVFFEGVQVPHSSAAVSYGISSPPTCTISLPASSFLRDLPETTKIHIIFKDLLPNSKGEYKWRLLFDGELSGLGYAIDANGANISISGVHSTAYLNLMQIMNLDAAQYLLNSEYTMLGNATMATVSGFDKVQVDMIPKIINKKNFKSMADLSYQILKNIIYGGKDQSSVGKWYYNKLGPDLNGLKLLERMYGVSDEAKNAALVDWKAEGGSNSGGGSVSQPGATTNTSSMSGKGGGDGSMQWPCSGEITSYFGGRIHPIWGTASNHSGMDIAVDYGTPIGAAKAGTVSYADDMNGYGRTVMIDHGDGLFTLYGHNQGYNVKEGQQVKAGDVIAFAGSTGDSTGPHCHFEVRQDGVRVDPLNYLP